MSGKKIFIVIAVIILVACIGAVGGFSAVYYFLYKPKQDFRALYETKYLKAKDKAWKAEEDKSLEIQTKYQNATDDIQTAFLSGDKDEMLKRASEGLAAINQWSKLIEEAEANFPTIDSLLKDLDAKALSLPGAARPAGRALVTRAGETVSTRKEYYRTKKDLIDNKRKEYEAAINYAKDRINKLTYIADRNKYIDEWNDTLIPASENATKKLSKATEAESKAWSDALSQL